MTIDSTFQKTGDMRFISHLDLMRLFQRALRRAGLPVAISQGFNPRSKISIKRALKLGVESMDEALTVHLSRRIAPAAFIELFNKNLPEGIKITKSEEIG